jgi:hypothetical protein
MSVYLVSDNTRTVANGTTYTFTYTGAGTIGQDSAVKQTGIPPYINTAGQSMFLYDITHLFNTTGLILNPNAGAAIPTSNFAVGAVSSAGVETDITAHVMIMTSLPRMV